MRIAYFTAGTVGAGHLVRGIAVGRGLARAGFDGEYRLFGPALPFPFAARPPWGDRYQTVEVRDDPALRDPLLAAGSGLAGALARFAPDLLIVDLFWAPLRFILPSLPCRRWLLLRKVPPVWLAGPRSAPFEPRLFDRIVAIEPLAPGEVGDRPGVITDRIEPVVAVNPDEQRRPEALRERFGVAAGERLTVVLHAGEAGERAELEARARGERALRFDLFDDDALFPAAEWLRGADRIVCGAGYNAFWEAVWLGHLERTELTPFERRIDDQAWRIATQRDHTMTANGADQLAAWLVA